MLVAIAERGNGMDVRECLRTFREQMLEQMAKGVQNPTEWLATNIKDVFGRENGVVENAETG